MPVTTSPIRSGRIGERLLEILAARGWSLGRLNRETKAHGAEVSISQLSLLTRGEIDQPRITTIIRICNALDIPTRALLDVSESTEGATDLHLRHYGVTTLVEVVTISGDGVFVETGERVGVLTQLLEGRERLLATVIDGGGMAPHIMIGDRVVFDPDAVVRDRDVVVLHHGAATLCAWYVLGNKRASYRLADGSWLRPDQVAVAGVAIHILRSPPPYLP